MTQVTRSTLTSLIAASMAFALGASQSSALELNRSFSDDMVLQREKPLKVWGTANESDTITVAFAGQTVKAKADEDGRWGVTLHPMPANPKGQRLTVHSTLDTRHSTIDNIVVGDVFLFARQSSIDVSLGTTAEGRQAAADLAADKKYRFIHIKSSPSRTPLDNLKEDATSGWQVIDGKSALAMSAAAFYLGRDLAKDIDVPIGIVDLDMGYHFACAWLSDKGLELAKNSEGLGAADVHWETHYRDEDIAAWDKRLEGYVRGKDWRGQVSDKPLLGLSPIEMPFFPSACYNTVIHPLRGLVVRGILLQLGNDYPFVAFTRLRNMGKILDLPRLHKANADSYRINKAGNRMTPCVLPVAVDDMRQSLGDASLPLAWIMPPGSDVYQYATHNREVREVQRRAQLASKKVDLVLPGAEHVPMSGQPADEALVAQRCKQWAMGTFYGAKGPVSGPVFDRVEYGNSTATVLFKSGTAEGLTAHGDALEHFEMAGEEREFVPCKAEIDGSTIKLTSDTGSRPMYVRFGWSRKPIQGLVNSAGLPAVPFNTNSEWEYDWWPEPAPVELPEEYCTPASKWPDRNYAIVNYDSERDGLHLGPTGLWGAPSGPNLYVDKITPGSPADGKVFVGDLIYGVNGTEFGPEPDDKYHQLAEGIARAEAEPGGGVMIANIRRKETLIDVPIELEFMGSYSDTSPWNCEKSRRIVEKAEAWMRNGLRPETGVPNSDDYAYGPWNANILFLLASGNPELQGLVRRYIRQKLDEFDKKHDISTPAEQGGIGWDTGYLSMLFGEYYHRTGDPTVLPYLEWMVDMFGLGQIQPSDCNPYQYTLALTEEQVGGFRGGRRSPGETMVQTKNPPTGRTDYGLMPACEMPGVMGMLYAKEAGLKVDDFILGRALKYLNYKRAENGFVLYAYSGLRRDEPEPIDPAVAEQGMLISMNGKLGTAAALFSLLDGYDKAVSNCSIRCVYAFNRTRTGHGGAWFNNYWTPIGAYHAGKEKFQYFMKGQEWWRELYRDHTGAVWQAHNAKGKASVLGVGFVAHRVAHHKRLRMYGAPRSAFGANPPTYLREALAAHRGRDYALAEKLIQECLAERNTPANEKPMVRHFLDSVQTVRKSIEYDLAYTEDALKRGEYYLADLELPQLKMMVAPENPRLRAIAATLESEEGKAGIAAILKRAQEEERCIRAANKAEAAEKYEGKSWEEELASIDALVKDGKDYGSPRSRRDHLPSYPEDEWNLWRLKVLETPRNAPQGWYAPEYDDSRWDETALPTVWPMAHTALMRTTFEVKDKNTYKGLHVRAFVYKQRNLKVYLNGELVAKVNNMPHAIDFPLPPYAMEVLDNGRNTLAVSTEHGKRFVDFGFRMEGRLKDGLDVTE